MSPCSRARAAAPAAGALGSSGLFPWLGVLRVHLHEEGGMKLALTGLVLVKNNYALGHADDVARIPKRIFQEDSRAMFVPQEGAAWYCRPVDYVTHPEYPARTRSSLALLELSMEDLNHFPVPAVCWPPAGYNTTSHLYAIGYTDENQALEKFIHPVQLVEAQLCKEFYDRAALVENNLEPVHTVCAHAPGNKRHCVWDTGLALASNATGHWLLLGLGLHGPGCSAPARFVSLLEYFPWIERVTSPSAADSAASTWRRSAFNIGFRPREPAVEEVRDVPAHSLLGRRQGLRPPQHTKHDFAHYYPHHMVLHDPFYIQRVDGARIDILPARGHYTGEYGNCSVPRQALVYKDWVDIKFLPTGGRHRGVARYHLTLYDTLMENYTCVSLRLQSLTGNAYLRYMSALDDASLFPAAPEEVVRVYPLYELSRLVERGPKDHLAASPVHSPAANLSAYNLNLFLEATFYDSCRFEIDIYGVEGPHPVTTTSTSTTSTTTELAESTTDPYKGPNERRHWEDDKDMLAGAGPQDASARAARGIRVLCTALCWYMQHAMWL